MMTARSARLERLELDRRQEVAETSGVEWGADGHRGHCSLSSRSRLEL